MQVILDIHLHLLQFGIVENMISKIPRKVQNISEKGSKAIDNFQEKSLTLTMTRFIFSSVINSIPN